MHRGTYTVMVAGRIAVRMILLYTVNVCGIQCCQKLNKTYSCHGKPLKAVLLLQHHNCFTVKFGVFPQHLL